MFEGLVKTHSRMIKIGEIGCINAVFTIPGHIEERPRFVFRAQLKARRLSPGAAGFLRLALHQTSGTGSRLFVGLIWNIPLDDLTENNHRLADKLAKFVTGDVVEMIFGVHQVNKQIDTALMPTHCCLLPPNRHHYPSTIGVQTQREGVGEALP